MYDVESHALVPKYEFQNPSDGTAPAGTLAFGSSKLYGLVQSIGIPYAGGSLFEYDTQTLLYQKIPGLPVDEAMYSTMVILENKLYAGGYGGTLFEFDLNNHTYNPLISVKLGIDYYDDINTLIVHPGDFHTTPAVVSDVVEFLQGKRKDGKTIDILRSDPQNALHYADGYDSPYHGNTFVSLGFGGSITVSFDNQLYNRPGFDLYVFETSYGNPSFYDYPEQAEVFVSQNGDDWISLGYTNAHNPLEECMAKLDTEFDIQHAGLDWIQFVKVTDVTDPLAKRRDRFTCAESDFLVFNSASDGYDLDAIHQIKALYPNYVTGRSASNNNSEVINISAPNATALLYPNPASTNLSINLSEEQELAIMEDDFHLEIIDTQGKIWTNSRELMDETWTINHDVSNLNPGMYIARVTNGNVRRHYKFMKN
ncbi:MAG: T9SS type A sorting domain-containing protein [Chryseolinea sp.]